VLIWLESTPLVKYEQPERDQTAIEITSNQPNTRIFRQIGRFMQKIHRLGIGFAKGLCSGCSSNSCSRSSPACRWRLAALAASS
jgi:hypothetical protein